MRLENVSKRHHASQRAIKSGHINCSWSGPHCEFGTGDDIHGDLTIVPWVSRHQVFGYKSVPGVEGAERRSWSSTVAAWVRWMHNYDKLGPRAGALFEDHTHLVGTPDGVKLAKTVKQLTRDQICATLPVRHDGRREASPLKKKSKVEIHGPQRIALRASLIRRHASAECVKQDALSMQVSRAKIDPIMSLF